MPSGPMSRIGIMTGRFFEDFTVGEIIRHPHGRTLSTADNQWLTLMTMNTNPIHLDSHYAAQTEFARPLVNSTLTLALVLGLTVEDISQHGINLGWDEVRMPAPVFEGDTIYAQSQVLKTRESKSRPHQGLIEVSTTGYKQDGTIVMTFRRSIMVYKRGHGPVIATPKVTS